MEDSTGKSGKYLDDFGLNYFWSKLKKIITDLQTKLSNKQDNITGGASTITSDNLDTDKVLVSDTDGKVSVSEITGEELSYMKDVTSNIQVQLDGKAENATTFSLSDGSTVIPSNGTFTLPILLKDWTNIPKWLFGTVDSVSDIVTTDPIGDLSVTYYPNAYGHVYLNIGNNQSGAFRIKSGDKQHWVNLEPNQYTTSDIIVNLPKESGTLITEGTYYTKTEIDNTFKKNSDYQVDYGTIQGQISTLKTTDTSIISQISSMNTSISEKEYTLTWMSTTDIDTLIDSVCV
jgi:hypothetical protein